MEKTMKGTVFRINEFGLCEVALAERVRAVFTLDKLADYRGQSFQEFGLREGAEVDINKDKEGRVSSARIVHRDTALP